MLVIFSMFLLGAYQIADCIPKVASAKAWRQGLSPATTALANDYSCTSADMENDMSGLQLIGQMNSSMEWHGGFDAICD